MKTKIESPLFTVNEVADYLRMNRQTVYKWLASGVLPKVKIGFLVRIPKKAIDDLIQRQLEGWDVDNHKERNHVR